MIAAELDINLPPLDLERVKKFINDTHDLHFSNQSFSREEVIYRERNGRQYPWDRRLLEYCGKSFYDYLEDEPFVQLAPVIKSLPIVENTRVVLLLYQEEQQYYDFNFHFDKDENFGFRICYGLNTEEQFVEFAKLKNEFLYVRDTLESIKDYMVEDIKYPLVPKNSNTVFLFNGSRCPHRVPLTNTKSRRLAIIVRGKLTGIQNLKYIQVVE